LEIVRLDFHLTERIDFAFSRSFLQILENGLFAPKAIFKQQGNSRQIILANLGELVPCLREKSLEFFSLGVPSRFFKKQGTE
jgi:hypothetical protein